MKGKLKVFVKPLKKIRNASIVLVGGTYILSSTMYGFNNVNKTIERDFYEIYYQTDDLFDALANDDLEHIDYDALSKVKSIRIDMVNANSFDNLKYFTNLNKIEICNSQLLTDKDIELLNYLPLEEINLYFDRNYVLKNINNKFDLNRFRDKKNINAIDFNNSTSSEEIDSIIFFEYLKNYENCNCKFIKYELLNDSLNKIIENLELKPIENDMDNLLKIVQYVSKHIHYDQDILDYNQKHSIMLPFCSEYWKLYDYNNKTISKVVSNNYDSDKPAICTNYSDYTLALCIKGKITSNSISGLYKNDEHSWNVVNINDYSDNLFFPNTYTYYLDTTWFDSNIDLKHKTDDYLEDKSYNELKDIKSKILITMNSDLSSDYIIDEDYDDYFNDNIVKSDINNIYGTRINQLRVFGFNALYSLLTYEGLSGIYILTQYLKKRKKIRDLKPEKKVKEKKNKEKQTEEKLTIETTNEEKKVKEKRRLFRRNKGLQVVEEKTI